MAVRQDKAIAIGPDWILRIEAEDAVPDCVYERGEGHGRAGVSGLGLLYGIYRERTNGVDAQLIELRGCQSLNGGECGTHDCLHCICWCSRLAARPESLRPALRNCDERRFLRRPLCLGDAGGAPLG